MYPHQAERLAEALDRGNLDALVAASPANVAYVSGFRRVGLDGGPALAVFTRQGTGLVVPALDVPMAVADGADASHIACYGPFEPSFAEPSGAEAGRIEAILGGRSTGPDDALAAVLGQLGVSRGAIGVDEGGGGRGAWPRSMPALGRQTVAAADRFASARRVKGPYEIECLGRALHIAEEALDAVIQAMERGTTEHEAAIAYSSEVLKRGAWPHPPMVSMGDRTWIPRARPSDRALRPGDLVRLDVACVYKGYWGGVARMAVLGEPAPDAERAHGALVAAAEAAHDAIAPAALAASVRAAAQEAARAAELAGHRFGDVGHGVGLERSEPPMLGPADETALETGEVLRVALAHFEIGRLGVAASDTVLVTSGGARLLNRSRHDLVVLD